MKTKTLPTWYSAIINSTEGRMKYTQNHNEVREFLAMFLKLRISKIIGESFTQEVLMNPSAGDIGQWFDIETIWTYVKP